MQENTQASSPAEASEQEINPAAAPGFVGYERDIKDHSSLDDLDAFVGKGFAKNYRVRFTKLVETKGTYVADWHWMAFLLPLPWLLYRKMFLFAVMYFIAAFSISAFTGFGLYIVPVIHVVMGALGTYLYYNHALRRVSAVTGMGNERIKSIKAAGGNMNIMAVAATCLVLAALAAGIMYAVKMMPQYLQTGDKSAATTSAQSTPMSSQMQRSSEMIDQGIASVWKQGGKRRLPAAAFDLQQEYGLSADLFIDEWKTEIEYWPTRKGYTLRSAGPDTEFGTDDDLFIESELK